MDDQIAELAAKIEEAKSASKTSLECDLRVDLAEALWLQKCFAVSIMQYDAALAVAQRLDDQDKLGMIYAGKACAMLHVGEPLDAVVECYGESLAIAKTLKNSRQIAFIRSMIRSAKKQWPIINGQNGSVATECTAPAMSCADNEICAQLDSDVEIVVRCFQSAPSADPVAAGVSTDVVSAGIPRPTWDISFEDAANLIEHDRSSPKPAARPGVVSVYAQRQFLANNISKFMRRFSAVMQIPSDTIDASVTASDDDVRVTVTAPYSVLVKPIHAQFDIDCDGYLSYDECQTFLAGIHAVQFDEYEQFCETIDIDPDTGLNAADLSEFYAGHDVSVLHEEYAQIFGLTVAEVQNLGVESMISAIVGSFDLDRDGHLKCDEFKHMFEKMSTLTPTRFEAICEVIGADAAVGVSQEHLRKWYESDTNFIQIMRDYVRVVLYSKKAPPAQEYLPGSDAGSRITECCIECVHEKVISLLGRGRYGECIDLVNYIQRIEASGDESSTVRLVESCQKNSGKSPVSVKNCRVWLVYYRAEALFRLMLYADALVDYKSLAGLNVDVHAGGDPQILIRNRIKLCTRKSKQGRKQGCTSGDTLRYSRLASCTSSVQRDAGASSTERMSSESNEEESDSSSTAASGGGKEVTDGQRSPGSGCRSLNAALLRAQTDPQAEEPHGAVSVDELLATFKKEDKLRAKRRAKRLRHKASKQKRLEVSASEAKLEVSASEA